MTPSRSSSRTALKKASAPDKATSTRKAIRAASESELAPTPTPRRAAMQSEAPSETPKTGSTKTGKRKGKQALEKPKQTSKPKSTKAAPRSRKAAKLSDSNDEFCISCLDGGTLFCCEECVVTYCEQCLAKRSIPKRFTCHGVGFLCSMRREPMTMDEIDQEAELMDDGQSVLIRGQTFKKGQGVAMDSCLGSDIICVLKDKNVAIERQELFGQITHIDTEFITALWMVGPGQYPSLPTQDRNEVYLTDVYFRVSTHSPAIRRPIRLTAGAVSRKETDVYRCTKAYTVDSQNALIFANSIARESLANVSRKLQDKEKNGSKFDQTCSELQLSEAPKSLPCRSSEFDEIVAFLDSSIRKKGAGSGLYVSGMPGTGKTATVRRVLWRLEKDPSLPNFRHIEINAVKLRSPKQVYVALWHAVFPGQSRRVSPDAALDDLERHFHAKRKKSNDPLVVIVDELDLLVSPKQNEIYNLFHWPTLPKTGLIVVGIANTMDLPERLKPRVQSRIGMRRIVFAPYSRQDLETILRSRLKNVDTFEDDAIELCSRKVAAVSGDVRRALQICVRAAELCKKRAKQTKRHKKALVDLPDIQNAVKQLFDSNFSQMLESCAWTEKAFLVAMLKAVGGGHAAEFDRVKSIHQSICHSLDPDSLVLNKRQVAEIAHRLEEIRVVSMETKLRPEKRVCLLRLNVIEDDVYASLQQEDEFKRILNTV